MGFFDRFFKKENSSVVVPEIPEQVVEQVIKEVVLELPDGEIVPIADGVLDVTSNECIQKFKHNLSVLIEKVKREGKIDNFKLIREDDYFPVDWQWQVASKNTCMEKHCLGLSYALKCQYALEKAGVKTDFNGVRLPIDSNTLNNALKGVDKYLGGVYLPAHFRSTKHFTVNTPLGVTGNYNSVSTDRNFIVIDGIENFMKSGFSYSIAYHDAYLDVTHKSLPLSSEAVVLIEQGKYETLKQNEALMSQLKGKKVVVFKGDETTAINMVLTELGALPSQIGSMYADYDNETRDIIDKSIRELATQNQLLFDKSHAGALTQNGGHFSNYYDDQNHDFDRALDELVAFLKAKFPEQQSLFTVKTVTSNNEATMIVEKIGTEKLLAALNEFNELTMKNFRNRYQEYKQDRESMTPEIEELFKTTIRMISGFYMGEVHYDSLEEKANIEEQIRLFLHADTVKEQLEASKKVADLISKKAVQEIDRTNIASKEAEVTSAHHL